VCLRLDAYSGFPRRAGGLYPSEAGLLLAPQALGMTLSYPSVGSRVERFDNRTASATGALGSLAGHLPGQPWRCRALVACELFVRGMGLSCIGIPSLSAAYSSVKHQNLPMATTTPNIVMRMGGPTRMTISATFLGLRLAVHSAALLPSAFGDAFGLLCGFHLILVAAALRLSPYGPGVIKKACTSRKTWWR